MGSLFLALSACAPPIGVGVPWLELPTSIALEAPLSRPVTTPVAIRNSGTGAARLTVEATPPFSVPATALVVPPGADGVLRVTFAPDGPDAIDGRLTIDDGAALRWVPLIGVVDLDADDDGAITALAGGDDCDDDDPGRFPGNPEVWYDGVDADCAGDDDHDRDADGERHPSGGGEDCDDGDPSVRPGAVEIWYDGVDQDCDGNDDDRDGDGVPSPVDCDDRDPLVLPDAPELDDGVDQDCDGLRDEGLWAAGAVLVSEVLQAPRQTPDPDGRFFELVNVSDGDVELGALEARIGPDTSALPVRWLGPGEAALLCANVDSAANGGLACDGAVSWSDPAPDAIAVAVAGSGLVLDEIPVGAFPVPNGASRELRASRFDAVRNDRNGAWCTAVAPFGAGDLGTPGDPSPSCL